MAQTIDINYVTKSIKHVSARGSAIKKIQSVQEGVHESLSDSNIKNLPNEVLQIWGKLQSIENTINLTDLTPYHFVATQLPELIKAKKIRMGIRTFDDLMLSVQRAIAHPQRGPALTSSLRKRFRAVLIDELQDTDSTQASVFASVFASSEEWIQQCPLLLIGDPKQSIYQFRGANLASYQRIISQSERYSMGTNYRSDGFMIHALNDLYESSGIKSDEGVTELFPGPPPAISYISVEAAHKNRTLAYSDGSPCNEPAVIIDLPSTKITKPGPAVYRLAVSTALSISKYLSAPIEKRLFIPDASGARPIRASDFAVLAHTKKHLSLIHI